MERGNGATVNWMREKVAAGRRLHCTYSAYTAADHRTDLGHETVIGCRKGILWPSSCRPAVHASSRHSLTNISLNHISTHSSSSGRAGRNRCPYCDHAEASIALVPACFPAHPSPVASTRVVGRACGGRSARTGPKSLCLTFCSHIANTAAAAISYGKKETGFCRSTRSSVLGAASAGKDVRTEILFNKSSRKRLTTRSGKKVHSFSEFGTRQLMKFAACSCQ